MPQLDRFLAVLVQRGTDSIELVEGEAAALVAGGAPQPITKPLTGPQLLMLIKEIAPADAARSLDAGSPTIFAYTSGDGAFSVRARNDGGKWAASIRRDGDGTRAGTAGATALETESPAAAAGLVRPAQPSAAVDSGRQAAARAEMERLLRTLVERGGSDLHLRVGEPAVIRSSGEITRLEGERTLDDDTLTAMLVSIMPEQNREEYFASNDTDFAYEIPGVARFRCNALKERKGAASVMRVIPAKVVSVEEMGISQEVQNLCYLTKGLVLVTGPTGSGKSTTLCSLVDLVNRSRSDHILTIEDPIEFVHPNKKCIVTQRQVSVHTTSFKSALRAALREDPNVILVGELRDLETTAIAIEIAETGHLVFGTLHTTTAAGTVDRIIDQFPADQQAQVRVMLSESLKGVISQTLCRRIGGGRAAAREIMLSIPAISNLVREGKTFQINSVIQTSKRLGMVTLNDALIELVNAKQVEPREAYTKAVDKTGFVMLLKNNGHDASFVEADPSTTPAKPEAAQRPLTGGMRR